MLLIITTGVLILLAVSVLVGLIVFFVKRFAKRKKGGKMRRREILAPALAIILWTLLAAPFVWFGIQIIEEQLRRGGA